METETGKKTRGKLFKQTKQLVRMALNDGWTQSQIADKCRTKQSVVSAWNSGAKNGNEERLRPLLELYGHKIRRNSFKLYWSWSEEENKQFYRVEGKVVFSHAFCEARRYHHQLVKKIPVQKLVVHFQGNNAFRVVVQSRIKGTEQNGNRFEFENCDESASWYSVVHEQTDVAGLLEFIDEYRKTRLKDHVVDQFILPFLIRKELLNHGFDVDGIEEYPAAW
ncbi:helix-turn-helix domain-containing protein [Aestuariirhabdus litorea]|uniref:XRE family transcriptional regulator n=1 Tax=Aestuariirhabdus litorea TaxID=2528527 RepID=A0A3P3VLJ5_9GAMM|nr:helix-turn-helix transcriptional regulator [Aestuariirhabdus litorea]RRJ82599.1 XRE family transcriptional regulator [Aestuariirhabdus litorea]RWW92758.1 XRE family transcriptional regulator [Endozoicomonadaceae bacterium GTF-13]